MTSTTGVRRRAGSTARVESSRRSGRSGRGGPVTVLQIYAVVLVVIPPTQIIGPLGAVGTPATVIGLGALVLWALGTLTPHHHLHRTVVPLRVVLGLVIGTILLGYTVLHSRFVPVNELMSSDRMLLQVLSWIGVGMLAAEGLADLGEVYRVLRALTAAVTVMAVVGILQFRFGIDLAELMGQIPGLHQNVSVASIQDRDGFRRPAGTATHPIEFGCVIAMAMPLALHLARFDMVSSRFRRWAPVFVIAMGIPVAVSRSAVLGAVVALVVIIAGLEPKLRPRALGAVAAFVLAIYVTTRDHGRVCTAIACHRPRTRDVSPDELPVPRQPVPLDGGRARAPRAARHDLVSPRGGVSRTGSSTPIRGSGDPRSRTGDGCHEPGERRHRVHLRRLLLPDVRRFRPARPRRRRGSVGDDARSRPGCPCW
jgi:hypothetical protein